MATNSINRRDLKRSSSPGCEANPSMLKASKPGDARIKTPLFICDRGAIPSELDARIAFFLEDYDLLQFSRVSIAAHAVAEEEFRRRHIQQVQYILPREVPRYISLGMGKESGRVRSELNHNKLAYFAFQSGYESLAGPSRLTLYGVGMARYGGYSAPVHDPSLEPLLYIVLNDPINATKYDPCRRWVQNPENQAALARIIHLGSITPNTWEPYQRLSVVPIELKWSVHLQALCFSRQNVRDLPDIFHFFLDLKQLDVSHNALLEELPPSCDSLKKLERLYVRGTAINPSCLERMLNALLAQEVPLLEMLDVNATQLEGLSVACRTRLVRQLKELHVHIGEAQEGSQLATGRAILTRALHEIDCRHLAITIYASVNYPPLGIIESALVLQSPAAH